MLNEFRFKRTELESHLIVEEALPNPKYENHVVFNYEKFEFLVNLLKNENEIERRQGFFNFYVHPI